MALLLFFAVAAAGVFTSLVGTEVVRGLFMVPRAAEFAGLRAVLAAVGQPSLGVAADLTVLFCAALAAGLCPEGGRARAASFTRVGVRLQHSSRGEF